MESGADIMDRRIRSHIRHRINAKCLIFFFIFLEKLAYCNKCHLRINITPSKEELQWLIHKKQPLNIDSILQDSYRNII